MKTGDTFALFEHEYDADDGLFTKFRMSDDVETERLEHLLKAMTTKLIIAFSRVFAG